MKVYRSSTVFIAKRTLRTSHKLFQQSIIHYVNELKHLERPPLPLIISSR